MAWLDLVWCCVAWRRVVRLVFHGITRGGVAGVMGVA